MSERKVPEVRFKEFRGEWLNDTLGTITDVYDGTHQTPKYTESGIMFLSVENIKTLQSEKYISEDDFINDFKVFPQKNDVLMTRIGDVGTANVVDNDTKKAYYVSLALLKYKKLNSYFLMESIHSQTVKREIWHKTLHIAFPKKINKNEIEKVNILFPNETDEQTKIGEFFKNLDNLIAQNQKKYDKLVNMKKACLGKMFPKDGVDTPEVRFNGFRENWEKLKLRDVIFSLVGGVSITPSDYKVEGAMTIPKGAINSSGIADLSGNKFVSQNFFDKNSFNSASTGDIVTSLRDLVPTAPNMGRIVQIKGNVAKYLMPQGVYKIELFSNVNMHFIIAYSNSDIYRRIISSEKNGSTQVHIRNGEYLDIKTSVPHIKEQAKIGTFFKNLDNLITLRKAELEKLKNIKKACLDKMFI